MVHGDLGSNFQAAIWKQDTLILMDPYLSLNVVQN